MCNWPRLVQEKDFSSVKTVLSQNSMSFATYCWAKVSLAARWGSVRCSFLAGTRWCMPAACSLRRTVAADTAKASSSRIAFALVKGLFCAAYTIRWSSSRLVTRGLGLLSDYTKFSSLLLEVNKILHSTVSGWSVHFHWQSGSWEQYVLSFIDWPLQNG